MPWRERPRRPSIFSDLHPVPNSLFGEIIDWLLAPLLLLWPISIAATYHVAVKIANEAFDPALSIRLERVIEAVRYDEEHGLQVALPPPPLLSPGDFEEGRIAIQVASLDGVLYWGNEEIPLPFFTGRALFGITHFRDDAMLGAEVRVAYRFLPALDDARPLLVQVAESRSNRRALSSHIISGVLLPQFIIIPLAVALVWLGLTRGLLPLKRLQERIRTRRPEDLSPIDLSTVPEELVPMVAAFNDMMARLAENLDAQKRFIAAAAHQMKTPLAGLKTQTDLALAEHDAGNLRDYLDRIAQGVDRAAHLAQQMLQLARIESWPQSGEQFQTCDLGEEIREAMARFVPLALARHIDLGFETQGEAKISAVPLLLREMIANLVDNAIKYSPDGAAVTVRMSAGPPAMVEVIDEGIGIPASERDRIFERFYRVLGTYAEGSGLGLAIVREIAELHGASIEVTDHPTGRGTVFRIILPSTAR